MPFFFLHDDGFHPFRNLFVLRVATQHSAHVLVVFAEQTGAEFAVGRQSYSRAMSAKSLGDWCDQSDFAGCAIRESIFPRGLALLVRNLLQRPARLNPLQHFGGW